ncbi:MAG: beta-ketoacyl-ACP synthase [Burkholderiales bacterium]|nr:beta-ketoacyl-ACP synthase [Burkholderiales bacterium]
MATPLAERGTAAATAPRGRSVGEPAWPVTACTLVTALGRGRDATFGALRSGRSGLVRRRFESAEVDTWLGVVDEVDEVRLPPSLAAFECRNNRLAQLALGTDGFADAARAAAARYGAHRVGVFLGTSTAGILATEIAYRERDPATGALPAWLDYAHTHNTYSVARFVRTALGLSGPAQVVSTACSSSAKVFGTAARMLRSGIVDAAVVGGVDTLCMTTLYGFRALELVSPEICRPWDAQRHGLSLGEGAAFALLERAPHGEVLAHLLACGESGDGHHMSAPHPEGAGAAAAMREALAAAALAPGDIDYLNLHGTATPGNDAAEDRAVMSIFGAAATTLACSSTKGYTGHTLGAAGGVEAAICLLALQHGWLPPTLNLRQPDAALQLPVLREPRHAQPRIVASNSFGFGGSNACLLFAATGVAA